MNELFTIGHSNHSLAHLLELLRPHNISNVIDVRSSPYSKYSPQFNKDVLEAALPNACLRYLYWGRELGARRSEPACYVDGHAKYDRIAQLPVFREGLHRILDLAAGTESAIMCSEADPITCHRAVLICPELTKAMPALKIVHILGDGTIETHEDAQQRLVKLHKLQRELFGELTTDAALVARAFDLQAEKLACTQMEE